MKSILPIVAALIGLSTFASAQEVTSQRDLKIAIDKLIQEKVNKSDLAATNSRVSSNEKSISKLQQEVKTAKAKLQVLKDIQSEVITKVITKDASPAPVYKGEVFNCHALNLRKDPSTNLKPRSLLKRGDEVKVIGGSDTGWLNVLTDKGAGWVSGRYIQAK